MSKDGQPLLQSKANWASERHHLLGWVLAIMLAKARFGRVEVVTESRLIPEFKMLELPIDKITGDLDQVKNYPKNFWAVGKIKAYSIQREPFVHLDNDVFLWRDLPKHLLEASICFQSPEWGAQWMGVHYQQVEDMLKLHGKNLPECFGICKEAVNTGIYICNDLDYNKRYCENVFKLIDNNADLLASHFYCNHFFEQHFAAATAIEMGVQIKNLVSPFDWHEFEKLGYSHLWGGSKNTEENSNSIEKIVKLYYPKQYKIIDNIFSYA